MKISLLINMKMPTIVGIFIFTSRENFMLSWVEHEQRFITSGPDITNEQKHYKKLHEFFVNVYIRLCCAEIHDKSKQRCPGNAAVTKFNLLATSKQGEMTENNDNTNATYKTLSDMIYMIKRVEALLLLQKDLGEAVLTSTYNLCFWANIRKIMYTPVNPSFII